MEGLGINLGYLLVQIVHFAIIIVVLNAWAVKPILKMLDKRRATIAQGIEDAHVAAEARANAEKEADEVVKAAQVKAADILREAGERANSSEKELRAVADAEIAKMREAAKVEIELERTRTLGELRDQVVALSMAATQKLIGESLSEERQRALLKEFFSGIKSGKIVVLEGHEALSGAQAEITSALPLAADEQEAVKKDLLASLGKDSEINFRVDPAILGGLIVRVGDHVIDGSVNGQLQTLRQNLK